MRRRALLATMLALAAAVAGPGAAAQAATARASLTDIENDVMCLACHEPLAVAQSPQAESERNFIRGLIAQGETKAQIEQALVANYGPAVLGKPPAHGFNLTVYILPPAILVAGLITLLVTLPRWRERARTTADRQIAAGPRLDPRDAARLDDDLAHFKG